MTKIGYVNVQTKNGIPYSYVVGYITQSNKVYTDRIYRPVSKEMESVSEDGVDRRFYPISMLPPFIRNFINSTSTQMSWWGSSGDESMYRFTRC